MGKGRAPPTARNHAAASRDMCVVLSGSLGGPQQERWQAEGSPHHVGTLVSDGTGLECEELLGSRGPALGGGEVSLPPALLHAFLTEMCLLPMRQSQTRALGSGSLRSGMSACALVPLSEQG